MLTGRLAPSPTGLLHLGNAFSFLLNWLYVRSLNGRLIMRIDDIDPQRSKTEFTAAAMQDLEWLGIDWDDIVHQSQRLPSYRDALQKLQKANLVYPCFCTRKDLRSVASAPQIGDMGAPYPGTCRSLSSAQIAEKRQHGKPACLRLRCPDEQLTFCDLMRGTQSFSASEVGGDFALMRSDGVFAYQLATVVDDGDYGINFVLRGHDLLLSTPRQLLLFNLLGHKAPTFAHTPLLLDNLGQRLAKRHKSLSIAEMRKAGISARQIIGYLGWLANILPEYAPSEPSGLLPNFQLDKLPKDDIILTPNPLQTIEDCDKIF